MAYREYDKKSKLATFGECPPDVNMVEAKDELRSDLVKESWMDPIVDYLKNSKEPEDKNQASKLQIQAARYTLVDGGL